MGEDDECCPICLDNDDDDVVEVHCGNRHRFHRSCMKMWISEATVQRCPLCREHFTAPRAVESATVQALRRSGLRVCFVHPSVSMFEASCPTGGSVVSCSHVVIG